GYEGPAKMRHAFLSAEQDSEHEDGAPAIWCRAERHGPGGPAGLQNRSAVVAASVYAPQPMCRLGSQVPPARMMIPCSVPAGPGVGVAAASEGPISAAAATTAVVNASTARGRRV